MSRYRTSNKKKIEIANNLILALINDDVTLSNDSKKFISCWIATDYTEKGKAHYDVWRLVLNTYKPPVLDHRLILFRYCKRLKSRKIESYTTSAYTLSRFQNNESGYILIFDSNIITKDEVKYFPLVDLIKRKYNSNSQYIKEEEYIVETNLGVMSYYKISKIKE